MKNILLTVFIISISLSLKSKPSQCYGSTSDGSIENTLQLPVEGENFVIYHSFGNVMGRNYVHSIVHRVILNSYAQLFKSRPNTKFKYAETGWKNGGGFKPHKTHQNGLSVDFMVPVINKEGNSDYFTTNIENKFGYDVEFDQQGAFQNFTIDFEAIAAHIVALDKAAKKLDVGVKRVIFAPELRRKLFNTSLGEYLKNNIVFMKNKAWVRHDEHYHIDFDISCKN